MAVDAGAEQRPGGVPGAGEVEAQQVDLAAVVEQEGAHRAALAVDAGVAAHLAGAGAAGVGGLEQHPVPQPVQGDVLAGGEAEQVTAVGADRLTRPVGVGQVDQEVAQVPGQRVASVQGVGDELVHS
jgi:hypothetical protein